MRAIYLCGTRGRDLIFERVTYEAESDSPKGPYPIQFWKCRICGALEVGPKEGPFGHVCPAPPTEDEIEELVRRGMAIVHRLLDRIS